MGLAAIFDFGLWKKIPGIFGRDMEAKFFIKGPKMSNQSSNLTSQRMVTESRFMTLLLGQYFSIQLPPKHVPPIFFYFAFERIYRESKVDFR